MVELKYYDLGYTEVFVFENYVINQIKEGEKVEVDHSEVLRSMIDEHYPDSKMIYISNRIHSYSVDPMIYLKVSEIDNLLGIAVIAYTDLRRKTAEFERKFCTKPYHVYDHLSEAISWVHREFPDVK